MTSRAAADDDPAVGIEVDLGQTGVLHARADHLIGTQAATSDDGLELAVRGLVLRPGPVVEVMSCILCGRGRDGRQRAA